MNVYKIKNIATVISYIEANLIDEDRDYKKLDLDTVANAVCYSKYHLHRMFTNTVGLTIHDYIQRRQLTEAAKLLVFSEKPIIEIALIAGYKSQQAFTTIFKSMYKQTPLKYRHHAFFYPLQLKFIPKTNPSAPNIIIQKVSYATLDDISDWMNFASIVIDGFPCLEETSHLKQIKQYIKQRQVILIRDGNTIVGAAAFSNQAESKIDFLAVHPQYRHYDYQISKTLLDFMLYNQLFTDQKISITTFREGDRADTGQRAIYQRLGFVASEFLIEFGYPTQRLILSSSKQIKREKNDDES